MPAVLVALIVLLAPFEARPADSIPAGIAPVRTRPMVQPQPPFQSAHVRTYFEHVMHEIVEEFPDTVVTSAYRSEAEQERLSELGYKPHQHSQHKLGLAWDCSANPVSMRLLAERAREAGLTAVEYPSSPVNGAAYVHVQLYERSPLSDPDSTLYEPPRERAVPRVLEFAEQRIEPPRLIRREPLEFPRRLLRKKAEGRVVLLVSIDMRGRVTDVQVDSSDLPAFEEFVTTAVRSWKFEPPTLHGHPIEGTARLPIPIVVN